MALTRSRIIGTDPSTGTPIAMAAEPERSTILSTEVEIRPVMVAYTSLLFSVLVTLMMVPMGRLGCAAELPSAVSVPVAEPRCLKFRI
jgi:hypothetical protein